MAAPNGSPVPNIRPSRRLYVEAGHSDLDPGAIAFDGTKEADLTIELRDLIVQKIEDMRVIASVSPTQDAPFKRTFQAHGSTMQDEDNMTLAQSIRHINTTANRSDLLLSIHFNHNHPTATGTEVFVAEGTAPENIGRAAGLVQRVSETLGIRIREGKHGRVKRDTESFIGRLGILRQTIPQAVLLEVCFLNEKELTNYRKRKDDLVREICKFYFGELSR